jgi:hypothetical protein
MAGNLLNPPSYPQELADAEKETNDCYNAFKEAWIEGKRENDPEIIEIKKMFDLAKSREEEIKKRLGF